MATPVNATSPGPVSDPRLRGTMNYMEAVQADLDRQSQGVGIDIPGNRAVYNERFKPLPENLFVHGIANPRLGGFQGTRARGRGAGGMGMISGILGVIGGAPASTFRVMGTAGG